MHVFVKVNKLRRLHGSQYLNLSLSMPIMDELSEISGETGAAKTKIIEAAVLEYIERRKPEFCAGKLDDPAGEVINKIRAGEFD